ncbi:epoxide hydrolase family protein [uncultured Amnibacterium sp.]|uniref:epoxide hydrolase family protein n=1 Tax=uncultured Amnibacterium sp. TaxID=1631851 RepID=UPI0035CA2514
MTEDDSFTVDVSAARLADLRHRLRATRRVPRVLPGWSGGTDPDWLHGFVAYWADAFDWPAVQGRIDALPQRILAVAGTAVHVIEVPGVASAGRSPLPLVLTHGWPSTFLEFERVIGPLTDPTAFGGDAEDAFTVVIPSLPGFGWSGLPPDGAVQPARIAAIWDELLVRHLGHPRFGAAGGDIGAHVTNFLGAMHADHVVGVATHHPPLHPPIDPALPLTDEERAYLADRAAEPGYDAAYAAVQESRPDTLAAALADSPAGLAAWIAEKYHDWTDGDVDEVIGPETLAAIVSVYWFSGCIGSSFRPYSDDAATPDLPPIEVPAAVSLTPEDAGYPRSFAERSYRDLRQWRGPDRGGHFLALENPARYVTDLRDFFRPLRASADLL